MAEIAEIETTVSVSLNNAIAMSWLALSSPVVQEPLAHVCGGIFQGIQGSLDPLKHRADHPNTYPDEETSTRVSRVMPIKAKPIVSSFGPPGYENEPGIKDTNTCQEKLCDPGQ